ncbi:MAG: TaqI-like C-terminal specificity domain-containing protein [Bryobacteraceae bacterium]
MSDLGHHGEWLSLIDVSGPFLAEPVLKDAFPQGLEGLDSAKKTMVRQAYDEWREALDFDDSELPRIHRAWINLILKQVLELDENGNGDILKAADKLSDTLLCEFPEHGITLRPDYALMDNRADARPLLLISIYDADISLTDAPKTDGWSASPAERMVELCRATETRLGLVSNGEQWMLVDAPVGTVTTLASWYARLWGQEPVTLRAFINLLGVRRFFVDRSEQLPALLDNSLKFQDEVTDALGEQVRRAVEVLIQALDRADVDRNRELFYGIEPAELYEAGLTVMMRIVFLLSAEERGLLLMGEQQYESNYAVSTLRMQLRGESEEILERRWDAWSRLLSVFRAVYGGVHHEAMRLPALGGSLFDPDRFPFLEGRRKGSRWNIDPATPLPIDNRTVLYLLDAVQLFQGRTLSYLALDIEQIGYVYEGLLERTAVRAKEATLDLNATKNAKNPWVSLPELDDAAAKGREAIEELLKDRTGSSANRVRNDLDKAVDEVSSDMLLTACHIDRSLRDRIKPYFHFLRTDRWGYPAVYPKGAFMVTAGADRRETGTHYTPKSLTEAIVKETLEPLVYVGAAQGNSRAEWRLKSSVEILDLKICDPAMGSGAFLVQACRWLSERLVESWAWVEREGKLVTSEGEVVEEIGVREPMRRDPEDRLLAARRLIAERCLYGVDMNPLAVELAKLSIWLVTLAKGRPFGFLDHNFRCGDSLFGIYSLDQLTNLNMSPSKNQQFRLFGRNIEQAVSEAIELRQQLRALPVRDIRDVEAMKSLDQNTRSRLSVTKRVANSFILAISTSVDRPQALEVSLSILASTAEMALQGDHASIDKLCPIVDAHQSDSLNRNYPNPFHWPIEYPEVFRGERSGFDAVISNPPWGAALSPALHAVWKKFDGDKLGRLIDSFHLFLIRASQLLNHERPAFAGLLVPDVLLYQSYSESLRRFLLTECRVISVCNIGDGVFARVTRPCCYIVFAVPPSLEVDLTVSRWRHQNSKGEALSFQLPPGPLRTFPGCIIPTNDLADYYDVARLVSALPAKLSSVADDHGIQRGASADNKDVFVLTEELAAEEKLEPAFLRLVISGGVHLKPFNIAEALPVLVYTTRDTRESDIPNIIDWVGRNSEKITCKEVEQGKHPIYALHRPREAAIFEKTAKLVGVITADRPKVAVDTRQLYALDGVYVFAARDGIDPYYVAGVLNSKLMAKIYRVFSQEEGRVMAQVKPTIIAELPIVSPEPDDHASVASAAKIAELSRILHGSVMEEEVRRTTVIELDALVENLFSRAAGLQYSAPRISDMRTAQHAGLERLQ